MGSSQIVLRQSLNEQVYQDIYGLEMICRQYEKGTYKLELDYKLKNSHAHTDDNLNEFLYYVDHELIGYIGICDFDAEVLEVTGMVHPDFRNQGIFSKLYDLVQEGFNKRPAQEMLLFCHKDLQAGLHFIEQKARYHHAEYDMYLDISVFTPTMKYRLKLEEIDSKEHLFIGKVDNTAIGQVRLELGTEVGGIYGLEIFPDCRRQGYGRELLTQAIEKLVAHGMQKVFLQVDTMNEQALKLYQSCGFVEGDVMLYYSISKN